MFGIVCAWPKTFAKVWVRKWVDAIEEKFPQISQMVKLALRIPPSPPAFVPSELRLASQSSAKAGD
jgi:hypothetical protein